MDLSLESLVQRMAVHWALSSHGMSHIPVYKDAFSGLFKDVHSMKTPKGHKLPRAGCLGYAFTTINQSTCCQQVLSPYAVLSTETAIAGSKHKIKIRVGSFPWNIAQDYNIANNSNCWFLIISLTALWQNDSVWILRAQIWANRSNSCSTCLYVNDTVLDTG